MPFWSLLLRVLLTVGLILNGSGVAVAAAHMPMQHLAGTGAALPPVAQVATAEPACADHHQATVPLADADTNTHFVTDAAAVDPAHPPGACCKSGACRCACVHQAPVAVPAVASQDAVVEPVGNVQMMQSGHESPALPHLIRPPIV